MTPRRLLLGLALLAVVFAAYGSLVPLRFQRLPLDEAVERARSAPYTPLAPRSKSDYVTNVLLFVPVGFFALGAAAHPSRRRAIALLLPVGVLSAAASAGIEFAQIFTVGRTPSWSDIEAQVIGYLIGAAAWTASGSAVTHWVSPLFTSASASDHVYRALGIYTFIWLVIGLLPLDFTIRPQELAQKFRAGRIVLEPFSRGSTLRDVGGTLLLAVPIGVFGVLAAAARGWRRPAVAGLGAGVALTAGLEAVQVLSVRRTADVTDVLVGAAGVLVGVWVATRWKGRALADSHGGLTLWPIGALIVWTLFLIIRHWSPYDFVAEGDFVRSRVPSLLRVPFHNYYWGLAPSVLVDATTKFLMGIPLGALARLAWRPSERAWRLVASVLAVGVAAAIVTVIELGQLLLRSRFPDQTDIYIGTAGALTGVVLVTRLLSRPV